MSNISKATVTIRGLGPILFHHFGLDALPLERRTERTGTAGNDPEEWRKTVLYTENKQIYLEPSCIRESPS